MNAARSIRVVVAGGFAAMAVAWPTATSAVTAADRDGWWNAFVGPQCAPAATQPCLPSPPESAGGVTLPVVTIPSPPTVPADSVAVGASGGRVDKTAAIGVTVDTRDVATTLTLKESSASGANVSADQAKVLACPITSTWSPVRNGRWVDRPKDDCALARAQGMRAADGTWTFALTPMASLWEATSDQQGVLLSLDPTGTAGSVQVSFLDVRSGRVSVGTRPRATSVPPPAPAASAPPAEPPVALEEFVLPSVIAGPDTTVVPAPVARAPVPRPSTAPAFGPRQGVVAGNLGAWLAALVVAGGALAFVTMLVLGPGGEPQISRARHGPVSRVLAVRGA